MRHHVISHKVEQFDDLPAFLPLYSSRPPQSIEYLNAHPWYHVPGVLIFRWIVYYQTKWALELFLDGFKNNFRQKMTGITPMAYNVPYNSRSNRSVLWFTG